MKVNDRGFNFEGDKGELEAYFKLKREYLEDEEERNSRPMKKKPDKNGGGPVQSETLNQDILTKMEKEAQAAPSDAKLADENHKIGRPAKPTLKCVRCGKDQPKENLKWRRCKSGCTKESSPGEMALDREPETTKLYGTMKKTGITKLPKVTEEPEEKELSPIWAKALKDHPELQKVYDKPAKKRGMKEQKALKKAYMQAYFELKKGAVHPDQKGPDGNKEEETTEEEHEEEEEKPAPVTSSMKVKPNVAHAIQQATGFSLKQMCNRYRYEHEQKGDEEIRGCAQSLEIGYAGVRKFVDSVDLLDAVRATFKEIENDEKEAKS